MHPPHPPPHKSATDIASCNILAMNNNPLGNFSKRILFSDENTCYRSAKACLGGHWAMAPSLGRQDSIISTEKYAKLWHGPLFVTWAEGLSTETVGENLFLAKNRTKFE